MPMHLEGSCRCGAIRFTVDSHTPYPYQRCYCSICRKTAGGGGYAINLMGLARSMHVRGPIATHVYHARIAGDGNASDAEPSPAERHFCPVCGCALWLFDASWPDLIHPFASAIDTALPAPPCSVHLMLRYKAPWVQPQVGPDDECFDDFPPLSIEEWHRQHGLWIA